MKALNLRIRGLSYVTTSKKKTGCYW